MIAIAIAIAIPLLTTLAGLGFLLVVLFRACCVCSLVCVPVRGRLRACVWCVRLRVSFLFAFLFLLFSLFLLFFLLLPFLFVSLALWSSLSSCSFLFLFSSLFSFARLVLLLPWPWLD